MAGPASIAPSHAVSQAKSSSSGSSSDDVSEGTLAQNNTKWQLRGLYVSLGGSLGWALVIALGWVLLESSPVAESVSSSTGVKDLHTYCAVAWSTFAGLAGGCRPLALDCPFDGRKSKLSFHARLCFFRPSLFAGNCQLCYP